MALKDIIGQERALSLLKGWIKNNRLPHALFFVGEEGIGKRFTAINLAKTLNCSHLAPRLSHYEIDCCDQCPSCMKIDRAIHPDVFLIAPENGQITVSTIRSLEESLSYKPFEGRWKVAIVDNAEMLNQSAANAFLRTLEEPPPQSILILVSARPEMIFPTIRSRCQRVNFSPLPLEGMRNLLRLKYKTLSPIESTLLSLLSGGRPGYVINEDLIKKRDRSFNKFKEMLQDPEKEIWEDREAMEEWFEWVQLWLRDIAVLKATAQTDLLINSDKVAEIKDISEMAELKNILKLAQELYNIKNLLTFNLNKQITFYYTSLLLKKYVGGV